MTHRLVLWDIDGTLLTTGVVGRRALERGAADAASLEVVPEVSMGGKTDPRIIAEILAAAGVSGNSIPELVPKALASAEEHLAQWRSWMTAEGRVHHGVREVLERLGATDGVRQTLLTGNTEANAFVKVDTFGLAGFFDFAIGAFGSDHADRDALVPVALERAARIRGDHYTAREAWIIGDTGNDVRCARAGGAHCLLVGTGREGIGALGGLTPDHLFDDLSDTEAVLTAVLGT
ncbi:MAG TPA: HAD hydrolase-like protein [Acidimicrobiales bacterium]|nr:HAD hydrolase-like protein [Acidimicrobiales bacterium]